MNNRENNMETHSTTKTAKNYHIVGRMCRGKNVPKWNQHMMIIS